MIVVYSVIERETFEHISNWIEEINTYGSNNVSIILVGNKIDLPVYIKKIINFFRIGK